MDVIADILGPLGIPVASGFPFGHEEGARAVVLGATAQLDERGMLTVRTGEE